MGTRDRRRGGAPLGRRPLDTALSFVTRGPRELGQNYLGLAGAEVPYANGSLLGEKEVLQMALCNLL